MRERYTVKYMATTGKGKWCVVDNATEEPESIWIFYGRKKAEEFAERKNEKNKSKR